MIIGSKFRPVPAYARDTDAGTYWERLPQPTHSELRVQKALLSSPVTDTSGNTVTYALPSNLAPTGFEQEEQENGF